jgi:AbrB family looped-hinge helix DNA binding protein
MRTTIDGAGRLVIPKEIRRGAGLKPGMELDVRLRDGVIEIEPAPVPTQLVRRGHLLVAVAEGDVEPLTVEQVDRIRVEMERERGLG